MLKHSLLPLATAAFLASVGPAGRAGISGRTG